MMIYGTKPIDNTIWEIYRKLMNKYGCMNAEIYIRPLTWYVYTGRSTLEFEKRLINARKYMIVRKLTAGGSDQEIINRIKEYLGVEY